MRTKIILGAILIAGILAFQPQACAQKKNNADENGFWQIVSNLNDPHQLTVQFYTKDRQLIYEEILQDVRLNLTKKNIRRKLNRTLKEAFEFWAVNRTMPVANDLVAKRL